MISWERHDALHVSNNWLYTVQMVKCKGVNFEENSQHATSNIQALIWSLGEIPKDFAKNKVAWILKIQEQEAWIFKSGHNFP